MYRSNGSINLLASGARTTTQTITTDAGGTALINLGGCGCRLIVKSTVIGTGSITASIQGISNTGATYTLLTGAAITTNTTTVYEIFPGAPATANVSANTFLPYRFQVVITANNANSATYQVDLDFLR
jgi:hypothetical protein